MATVSTKQSRGKKPASPPTSDREEWDRVWGAYYEARKSGDRARIIKAAAACEAFDNARGWTPTVTAADAAERFDKGAMRVGGAR